jgi:hypothetical protein
MESNSHAVDDSGTIDVGLERDREEGVSDVSQRTLDRSIAAALKGDPGFRRSGTDDSHGERTVAGRLRHVRLPPCGGHDDSDRFERSFPVPNHPPHAYDRVTRDAEEDDRSAGEETREAAHRDQASPFLT